MEQELRAHLLETAERIASHTGLSEQTIGQRAIRDNTFFRRLREKDAGFTVRTYDRLMQWMNAELARAQRERAQ